MHKEAFGNRTLPGPACAPMTVSGMEGRGEVGLFPYPQFWDLPPYASKPFEQFWTSV